MNEALEKIQAIFKESKTFALLSKPISEDYRLLAKEALKDALIEKKLGFFARIKYNRIQNEFGPGYDPQVVYNKTKGWFAKKYPEKAAEMTLSRTLMRPSGFTTWKVLPTPSLQIRWVGSRWISRPL